MSSMITIGIDHGNSMIKTRNYEFVAGIKKEKSEPVIGSEVIHYGDAYYSLTPNRGGFNRDKTMNDDYFALTLFAIVKELIARNCYVPNIRITLAVGIPPEHMGKTYMQKFRKYIKDGHETVSLRYNKKTYVFSIASVKVFPQAFAASITRPDIRKKYSDYLLVDIGGFTLDLCRITDNNIDVGILRSFDSGIIVLGAKVIADINTSYDLKLTERMVNRVLSGKEEPALDLKPMVKARIMDLAKAHVNQIFSQISEQGIDTRVTTLVFIGGGSCLLKKQIEEYPRTSIVEFISDTKANAIGYEEIVGG